ncbi:28S ribosomal protein S33, mitochondrial [Orussus abietinus]|uniref:28S ribosomal protein S33, mitochondrial n=1 Tax=Orussus abietinus TaxID=222816 RepID=UPI000625367E|nr:28S ribosomal protein S33, mitochondrial [Orussus abietinus]XP_012271797.1 28S ribosomal protein S33, mitochondrial [Orussus abietinus]XP_023289247.1 28S ribosomal protein S33, mitochondrial [Orussus abietinus]
MAAAHKYVKLSNVASNYAKRMNRLSNSIFGEVTRPTSNKSMKVVQLFSEEPIDQRSAIVEYYPRHIETGLLMKHLRDYGLFRDEHQDFKEEYERLRELRGKGDRKKGEGKKEKKHYL